MPVDVTVVVPVYNTGPFIEPCIESLLAQTLKPGQLELIFVDDGSTDETPARLDRLAADHDHVRVFHEPPSGWPGRPRNVGIDAAQGEFVYFVDHDDALAPDALEHLVATARRTGADVVLGKIVGVGRGAPLDVFAKNVDRATLGETPLMSNLTPHKLFRKALLDSHEIRFPEGKRRLEDHVFVVRSYLAAGIISILADRPCYFHIDRADAGNASATPLDPAGYFANVRESLDIIDRQTEPGAVRDRMRSRFLTTEALRRLDDERIRRWSPDYLQDLVTASGTFIAERYRDEEVDALPPVTRARAHAVRRTDVDQLLDITEHARAIAADASVVGVRDPDDPWAVDVRFGLTHADGRPVTLTPDGEGWCIDTDLLPERYQPGPYPTAELVRSVAGRVVLRNRKTSVQWLAAADLTTTIEPLPSTASGGARRIVVTGTARLDPETAAAGRPLPPGRWEVSARMSALGLSRTARLVPAPDVDVATTQLRAKKRGLVLFVDGDDSR